MQKTYCWLSAFHCMPELLQIEGQAWSARAQTYCKNNAVLMERCIVNETLLHAS
jgi:hypothetical protein